MWRKEDVVEQLKAKQKESGLSQRSYAKSIGVTASCLNDVLTGRRDPGEKILNDLGLEATIIYQPRLKWRKEDNE